MSLEDALLSLEGLSVGDAFGTSLLFPQAADRIARRELPKPPWRWTDNTQMAFSVVEELRQRGWIDQDSLARRYVHRYLSDPARGYGTVTRQTLERIAHGEYFRIAALAAFDGGSFGVAAAAWSAPAGGFFSGNAARAAREARLAAGVTHMHPEGVAGAEAVAAAAALAGGKLQLKGADFLRQLAGFVSESLVRQAILLAAGIPEQDLERAVGQLGAGRKRTAQDTVPFALWCAAHHLDDFEAALWWTASASGSLNTTCAIVGAIVALSAPHIPPEWLRRREPLPHNFILAGGDHASQTGRLGIQSLNEAILEAAAGASGDHQLPAIRVDALTGIPDLLGLFDWLNRQPESGAILPFSLMAIQLPALWRVNRTQGRMAGDELLRRYTKALQARYLGPIFRVGGDKFVVVFQAGNPLCEPKEVQEIRLDSPKTGQNLPPARIAVIHFSRKQDAAPGVVLASLFVALADRYHSSVPGSIQEFKAADIQQSADFPWMMVDLADQLIRLDMTAYQSLRLAQTDSISQLPNMRAALSALETCLIDARQRQLPLAVLLIDGDNLRRFNELGYEAGDEAIRLLGSTLQEQLREVDFLARWRTGDEFLVVLPGTAGPEAVDIGKRLRAAVEAASRSWHFPATISIGVALYPQHGQTVQELVRAAEMGLDAAKHNGKNQVVLTEAYAID